METERFELTAAVPCPIIRWDLPGHPACGEASEVRELSIQATRYEPARSLGLQGYCKRCDCSFKVSA